MNFASLLLLGFIAGATILLGLLVGRLKAFNSTAKSFLSMLAAGILIFLIVDVLGDAGSAAGASFKAPGKIGTGILLSLLLAGGLALGLLSLVWFSQQSTPVSSRAEAQGGPKTRRRRS